VVQFSSQVCLLSFDFWSLITRLLSSAAEVLLLMHDDGSMLRGRLTPQLEMIIPRMNDYCCKNNKN
jgi:hypothetical protein